MQSPYMNGINPNYNNVKKNYSIISLIGKGSFGSVYLVKSNNTSKTFACKKIKISIRRAYDKKSILNELKLLACHKSEYIIKLEDAYISNNHIHLVTEYAERGDLSKLVKRCRSRNRYLIEDTVKKYLFEICLGIQYLHKNNIIHRDIKTANIFLTKDNNIKLGDVGIVKILKTANNYAYTNIGTPYYMSPELYKNFKYTSKTDIWSIGVVLYELMTFKLPYNSNNLAGLKYKISHQNWFMENKYKNRYSKELYFLLTKLLEPSTYLRYSIDQVLESDYLINDYNKIRYKHIEPFSRKFFSEANVPLCNNDWNKVIKKFVNNDKPKPPPPKETYPKKLKPISNGEGFGTKALKIIDKMDNLMLHVSSEEFKKYRDLKKEIKDDINNYRVLYKKENNE
tara:strand:- start:6207 stop:7397 length:1191 start_codon:yes stop_codon:yes gene_type:complete